MPEKKYRIRFEHSRPPYNAGECGEFNRFMSDAYVAAGYGVYADPADAPKPAVKLNLPKPEGKPGADARAAVDAADKADADANAKANKGKGKAPKLKI